MPAPSVKLLCSHPAHLVSLGLGSGLAPKAPGTFGSLAAWLLFLGFQPWLDDVGMAVLLLISLVLGAWCIQRTGKALGEVDHGAIVWDEFVAVWLVLWLSPAAWGWQAFAVGLFRFFDILKPWPIRQADARFKNGFGVMLDDLLAAGYTLLVMALTTRGLHAAGVDWL